MLMTASLKHKGYNAAVGNNSYRSVGNAPMTTIPKNKQEPVNEKL